MARITVKTDLGTIVGKTCVCQENISVDQYLGIPYAEPPQGKLRLKDPKPLKHLPSDPYEAFSFGPCCPQQLDLTFGDFPGSCLWNAPGKQSEDCLFLNIWAPTGHRHKVPVMVWIYGGGFYNGTSDLDHTHGEVLAGHGKVIVVTFNYRTGVLGFFSTGDGKITGNFGLKDQICALNWVKDNIGAFGGDADNITVFGESAGSSSIGFHLMSTKFHKGLFHKAIFQSGSPKSQWSFTTPKEAEKRSKEYLAKIGFSENNNDDLVSYLMNVDVETIVNNDDIDCGYFSYPWVPTIDAEYLLDSPVNLLSQNKFHVVDSIFGCNLNEGSYICLYQLPQFFTIHDQQCLQSMESFEQCQELINSDLQLATRVKIKEFYIKHDIVDTNDHSAIRTAIDNMNGDRSFVWPVVELQQLLASKGARTYMYYLKHRASNEVWPQWMGVLHGADIQWIFGSPLRQKSSYTADEKTLSRNIITYVTNFAKYGKPSVDDSTPEWPQCTHGEYLSIDGAVSYNVLTDLRGPCCRMWQDVFKQLNINN